MSNLKFCFAILLILSFFGIAVFGFTMTNHNSEHRANGCIAATVNGSCLKDNAPFTAINFHLNAFKNFSKAVFNENFIIATILAFFTLLIRLLFFKNDFLKNSFTRIFQCEKRTPFFSPSKKQFSSWLALLEISPTIIR